MRDSADATEFEAVLKAVDFAYPRSRDLPRAGPRRRFVLVVAGSNEFGDRTALAINLALTAARGGARVVLLDAAGRNAKLTRAVRVASRKPILDAGAVYETENDVRLALPKALDAERGRQRPEAMLRNFLDSRDEALDLIVCDGPGASEVEAASVFEYANAIVALDGAEEAATLEHSRVSDSRPASSCDSKCTKTRRAKSREARSREDCLGITVQLRMPH